MKFVLVQKIFILFVVASLTLWMDSDSTANAFLILTPSSTSTTPSLSSHNQNESRILRTPFHDRILQQEKQQQSSLSPRTKTTKMYLFWSRDGDKDGKSKDQQSSSSNQQQQQQQQQFQQSTNKMGTTAAIMDNFKQSQDISRKTNILMSELSSSTTEGTGAKGKIKVYVDGQQQPMSVEIDEEYYHGTNVEEFTEALIDAMQDAHKKSQQMMQDKMQGLYSELGLPSSK